MKTLEALKADRATLEYEMWRDSNSHYDWFHQSGAHKAALAKLVALNAEIERREVCLEACN